MDRLEFINFWGFSPAINFLQTFHSDDDELNILLVGSGDCRHIIETWSSLYKHPSKTINFYVVEKLVDLYAREMLMLKLLLEPQHCCGAQEKTELFLEIHGNLLVRPHTVDYIQKSSQQLLEAVCDFEFMKALMPIFDLSNLKYKEVDNLENIFKYWKGEEKGDKTNLAKCWDWRLRENLGVRYDAIPNVFDWHYHMNLCDKGAEVVGNRKYIKWRGSGIAYELRDGDYNCNNKTLAIYARFKDKRKDDIAYRGYWGDVILSPYISFGVKCPNQKFFKKQNHTMVYTSEDVSQYNINKITHQINHREDFKEIDNDSMNNASTNQKCEQESKDEESIENINVNNKDLEDVSENVEKMCLEEENEKELDKEFNVYSGSVNKNPVRVIFLPTNSLNQLYIKQKFHNLFHVAYFSVISWADISDNLHTIMKDNSNLIIETDKFLLEVSNEDRASLHEALATKLTSAHCQAPKIDKDYEYINIKFEKNTSV